MESAFYYHNNLLRTTKTFLTIESIRINNDLITRTKYPYSRLVLSCKIECQKNDFLYLKLILVIRRHKLKGTVMQIRKPPHMFVFI